MNSDGLELKELKDELDQTLSGNIQSSGGKKRAAKANLTKDVFSKIINYCIKETSSNYKLINKESELPTEIKKRLPKLLVSEEYKKHKKVEFKQHQINEKGVDYDAFIIEKDELKMLIEYKSYTETSMLRRVLFDAWIAKDYGLEAKYCLCMLETSMGFKKRGEKKSELDLSYQSHAFRDFMIKHHDVDIDILILLDGQRKSQEDIAEEKYRKKIPIEKLKFIVNYFKEFLKKGETQTQAI
mgnify:CR=1 FL=1|tara:strand:+ start:1192 stop:1914 length:723 start_codon:yes stop_codon:yes gene_type:complete